MEYMTTNGIVDMFKRNNVNLDKDTAKNILEVLCNEGVYMNQYQLSDKIIDEALANSNYKVTQKNRDILRESLKTGTRVIDTIPDTEYYANILKENRYQVTPRNVSLLIEGLTNGNEKYMEMAKVTSETNNIHVKYVIVK